MKKFNGDVQQAVMGNVKQGSQLTNEVHLHVVGGSAKKPERIERRKTTKKTVSSYQKRQLYMLSLEWGEVTGIGSVNAYGIIFDHFNISRIEELLSEHYPGAKEMMESQVSIAKAKAKQAELTQHKILATPPLPITPAITQPVPPVEPPAAKVPCQACLEKSKYITVQKSAIIVQWVAIAVMILTCWYLFFKTPAATMQSTMYAASCFNNGKAFSVGSTATLNKELHECTFNGDVMEWKAIQRSKKK